MGQNVKGGYGWGAFSVTSALKWPKGSVGAQTVVRILGCRGTLPGRGTRGGGGKGNLHSTKAYVIKGPHQNTLRMAFGGKKKGAKSKFAARQPADWNRGRECGFWGGLGQWTATWRGHVHLRGVPHLSDTQGFGAEFTIKKTPGRKKHKTQKNNVQWDSGFQPKSQGTPNRGVCAWPGGRPITTGKKSQTHQWIGISTRGMSRRNALAPFGNVLETKSRHQIVSPVRTLRERYPAPGL